jgi:hypothetical protein
MAKKVTGKILINLKNHPTRMILLMEKILTE